MNDLSPLIPRRDPNVVMRLSRLGSLHQSRLSFMRILMRRMASEDWTFSRPEFDIDEIGVGYAVYSAKTPNRSYSLVAFAHDLPPEDRSDRVIANAWDATFTLFDGVPTRDDIQRLSENVPVQEAGRITEKELTMSRANRSVRLWEHVVEQLSNGQQPDLEQIQQVGYLMRTTAVYGSGKFGAADRETIEDRSEFKAPFQVEMLTVYLIRTFVKDLVEHMARAKGGNAAAPLSSDIAKQLGIGNSTGLGMAPFLINHPILFSNWIMVREEAISRVRSVAQASKEEIALFLSLFDRCRHSIDQWTSEHPIQKERLSKLKSDIASIVTRLDAQDFDVAYPWDSILKWAAETLSEEGQEFLNSLVLEPYAQLVDGLSSCMSDHFERSFHIDGAIPVENVRQLITDTFGWALSVDWTAQPENARAWYVSEEKLEPRLGERFEEPIAKYEQPLAPARDAAAAFGALKPYAKDAPISAFLADHPHFRHTIRRAQMSALAPYSEIRDNTISAELLPIDMLRAKLSFFGAIHFDPRSDRWVRICMFSGAPYPADLTAENADFWIYPEVA